jgi:hypothetical protein
VEFKWSLSRIFESSDRGFRSLYYLITHNGKCLVALCLIP